MLKRAVAVCAFWLGSVAAAPAADDASIAKAQEAAAALQRGNAQLAVTLCTEALKDAQLASDRRAGVLNDRGVAYARLDQPKLAIEDFNRAVQVYPEYPVTYNNRGNLLMGLGLAREAVKDFDRALVLAPGYAAAYNNRAGAYMRLGQMAEAIRDYTKAIELMPSSAAPLSGRGRAHLTQARPHAAMRDFSRALQTDSRFGGAYRARAEAKLAVQKYEEAAEDLSRAIAFEPNSAEIHVLRGQAYLLAKNIASAIKDYSRAIEIDPRLAAAYLGRALASAKAEAFEDAEADLAKALEIDPRSALSFAYRAWVYKLKEQPDLGAKEVEKAIRLDPQRAEVHWAKAEIEESLGRTEEAVASYRRAVALMPSLAEAAEGLQRLGAETTAAEESDVPGSALQRWRIVTANGRYFAVNDDLPKLRVPLEMMGEGSPRLLEWELKPPPFKGIGALRYHAGMLPAKGGEEEFEQIAIIDVPAVKLVGLVPHRQGQKQSTWTWDDGRLVVASIDGVSDEFNLRPPKPKEQAAAPAPRRTADPWRTGSGRSRGPKTLFDFLFGN